MIPPPVHCCFSLIESATPLSRYTDLPTVCMSIHVDSSEDHSHTHTSSDYPALAAFALEMKLKHLESALQSVTTYSELGTDKVNIDLEQYRYRGKKTMY